jgi:hypothetical protein
MKKLVTKPLLFTIATMMFFALLLFACAKPNPLYITVNGDIEGVSAQVNLNNLQKVSFQRTRSGETETFEGYKLDAILQQVAPVSSNFDVLISSKASNTAALINNTDGVYIIEYENGLRSIAPNHPPIVGIRDILYITVICKGDGDDFKILSPNNARSYTYGQAKLLFFSISGGEQTSAAGNVALRYDKQSVTVKSLTNDADVFVYFSDYSIAKANVASHLTWVNGRVHYNEKVVFGIATGAEHIITDAFFGAEEALDNDVDVLLILIDGLSWQQLTYFGKNHNLGIFASGANIAVSVHPAITPVATTSVITGACPKTTGTTTRDQRQANVPDIFDYASSLNKTAAYIGLSRSIILTNIAQTFTMPDRNGLNGSSANIHGLTDVNVFANAKNALSLNPNLLFVHFKGIDDIGHYYGPYSNQALQAILRISNYVYQLAANFNGRIVMVSDHGMAEYTDASGETKGNHGLFLPCDMFVPFWVIDK